MLIGGKGGVRVDGARVDDGTEIHGLGPLGAGEAVGLDAEHALPGVSSAGDERGKDDLTVTRAIDRLLLTDL